MLHVSEHRSGHPLLYVLVASYQLVYAACLGSPVFERFQESRLIETAGPPTGLPSSSASFSLSLIQQQGSRYFCSVWFVCLFVCLFIMGKKKNYH